MWYTSVDYSSDPAGVSVNTSGTSPYSSLGVMFQVLLGDGSGSMTPIVGTASGESLYGTNGNDLITGNGGADRISAGTGNDTIVLNASNVIALSQGSVDVDGGSGIDTLKIDGSGITLNLQLVNGNLRRIEKVDITGSGNNTVRVSVTDMKDERRDLSVDAEQLFILGNPGDTVWVGDPVITAVQKTFDGITYNSYTFGADSLLVQQGVTVVFAA